MKNNSGLLRLGVGALAFLSLLAGFLIANINVFDISLIYLGLIFLVMLVGLVINIWGGLILSGVTVFALVLLNQYVGIYPVQNSFVNISTELAAFLIAGPLAGWISKLIEDNRVELDRWISLADSSAVHDRVFKTIKVERARSRLEEEIVRAQKFSRALSVVLLQYKNIKDGNGKNRIPALQGLIRVAQSQAELPGVVAYYGNDRVLVILPEQDKNAALKFIADIQKRSETEMFFPESGEKLGRVMNQWGDIVGGAASLGGEGRSADALLQSAASALES
jgi:GGDEF domain-containing protein